jgi:hypothetical protein
LQATAIGDCIMIYASINFTAVGAYGVPFAVT